MHVVAAVVAVLDVDADVVSVAEATPVVVSAGAAVFSAHFASGRFWGHISFVSCKLFGVCCCCCCCFCCCFCCVLLFLLHFLLRLLHGLNVVTAW